MTEESQKTLGQGAEPKWDRSQKRQDVIELQSAEFLNQISFSSTRRLFIIWFTTLVILFVASIFVRLPLVEKLPGAILTQDDRHVQSSIRSGIVADIFVDVGDLVEDGQPLILMRSSELPSYRDMQIRHRQLEERLQIQSNSISRLNLQLSSTLQQSGFERAQLERDIVTEQNTQERLNADLAAKLDELEDQEILRSSGLVTTDKYITITSQVRSLENSIRNSAIMLEGLQSQLTEKREALALDLEAIELEIMRAEMEEALLRLDIESLEVAHEWTISANFSGVVSALQVSVGNNIAQGISAVNIIPEGNTPRIEFYQSSNTRLTVTEDTEVKIAIDAYPTQNYGLFSARVIEVGRSAEHQAPQNGKLGIATEQPSYRHVAIFQEDTELPQLEDGYSVLVSVLVEDRSVFDWLISPFFIKEY